MTVHAISELLDTALAAANEGADLLARTHREIFGDGATRKLAVATKSSDTDFVTEADKSAQEAIISCIRKRFPDHRFIAEEEGAEALGHPDSPYEWIIDPLDGTTNFIHGKRNFGSIVAVQRDGELLAGAMRMPLLGLVMTGTKGGGAFVNGERAVLRKTAGMTDAILSSNIVRRATKDGDGVLRVSTPYCASLENCGCAAMEMGEIIQGYNDGAFFRGIRLWDIAAGCLMIAEAGGRYRYEFIEPGNPRGGMLVVASTETIFEDLCAFVFEKKLT